MSNLRFSDSTYNAILEGCRDGKLLIVAACLIEAGNARDPILTSSHYSADGNNIYVCITSHRGVLLSGFYVLLVSESQKGQTNLDHLKGEGGLTLFQHV